MDMQPNKDLVELAGTILEQVYAVKQELLAKEAMIWRLRHRFACKTQELFEEIARHDHKYFYSATGIGPALVPGTETLCGHKIAYKHTAAEWARIWQDVAEKLHTKRRKQA